MLVTIYNPRLASKIRQRLYERGHFINKDQKEYVTPKKYEKRDSDWEMEDLHQDKGTSFEDDTEEQMCNSKEIMTGLIFEKTQMKEDGISKRSRCIEERSEDLHSEDDYEGGSEEDHSLNGDSLIYEREV